LFLVITNIVKAKIKANMLVMKDVTGMCLRTPSPPTTPYSRNWRTRMANKPWLPSMTLSDLERLAKKATKGKWKRRYGQVISSRDTIAVCSSEAGCGCCGCEADPKEEMNMEYIAAVNPDTILKLIARIWRLEGAVESSANQPCICSGQAIAGCFSCKAADVLNTEAGEDGE